MDQSPESLAATLNDAVHVGWVAAMGLRLVRASIDEVVAEMQVGPQHKQPYGVVHGGVHAGVIESLASLGAALVAMPRGQSVVGLDNHTTFLRAAREGTLTVTARPLSRGRSTQVWEGDVRDEQGKLLATGRVRLLCLEPGAKLAGEPVEVQKPRP